MLQKMMVKDEKLKKSTNKIGQSIKKDYENYFPRFWGPYYDPGNRVSETNSPKVTL